MYVCMYVCMYSQPKMLLPPCSPHPFASEKATPLPGIPPTRVYQVSVGLGISSPTEARQGRAVSGTGSTDRQQSQNKPLALILKLLIEIQP